MSKNVSIHPTMCCGLRILRGLNTDTITRKALITTCISMYQRDRDCAFMAFSGDGRKFVNYINRHRLGSVKSIQINGNMVWIWEVDNAETKKWFSRHRK